MLSSDALPGEVSASLREMFTSMVDDGMAPKPNSTNAGFSSYMTALLSSDETVLIAIGYFKPGDCDFTKFDSITNKYHVFLVKSALKLKL